MKAIILSIVQYKEKDAIIQAITANESFSFLAKGILNPKNINATINNPMTIAEIELSDRAGLKHPMLKSATVISSPLSMNSKLENLASLQMINEAVVKCLSDEEKPQVFAWVEEAISRLKKTSEYYPTILLIFANVLKAAGYGFEVNHCVFCGKKSDIVDFSFIDGGFVCRDCQQDEATSGFSKEEMLYLRYIFNAKSFEDKPSAQIEEKSMKIITTKFLEFIKDNLGVTIKSSELLLR